MNTKTLSIEKLNSIIKSLKKREINYHRLKIVSLSKSILMHPEDKISSVNLHESLKRLEYLLCG